MWIGRLSLDFERSGGKTVISRRRHEGPLLIQRPFHEPDGACQVYLIHPPGGVVGGDSLAYRFEVRDGSRVLVTTPGATKLYRSPRQPSRIQHDVLSTGSGTFEWLPQETIAFAGTQAEVTTLVRLALAAQFIGWDITCLGHDNRGLPDGLLTQEWHVERDGRSLWRERSRLEGGSAALTSPWGLAGRSVFGTLVATGASDADVDAVRDACPGSELDWVAVTRLGEVLLCRYLGYSAEAARRLFQAAWAVLRRRLLGRDARPPRVWAT
jgi:urease accessory protein